MTVFQLLNGTMLYSENAVIESGFVLFETKHTCLLQVNQIEGAFRVNAIPASKLLMAPSKLSVPSTALAQMSDCKDENVVKLCRDILEGKQEEKSIGNILEEGSSKVIQDLRIVRRK